MINCGSQPDGALVQQLGYGSELLGDSSMLKIWYCSGIKYMEDAPSYFDNTYEDEWIVDPFVKEMIRDVDGSEVVSAHIIESPVLGAITPKELSGGVKVLILMLKDDSFVYNLSNCGDNCAKWALEISKDSDVTVFLQHIMKFPEPFEIEICNSNVVVRNYGEYVNALIAVTDNSGVQL